jgi:hypothetical protein
MGGYKAVEGAEVRRFSAAGKIAVDFARVAVVIRA